MNKIKISIIIIFDQIREEKLRRLLDSIRPQLLTEMEVLLIHESFVPARQPIFSILPVFPIISIFPILPVNIRYIPIPEKQGIPFNRNQGIQQAHGEIIVFIDDDCWVPEGWLDSLVTPLQQDQDLLAVTGGTRVPPSNLMGDCIAALGFPGGGSLGFEKVWKVSSEGYTNHLSVGNCALQRKIFPKVGLFDESMKSGAEDTEFSYRLELAGIPIKYVSKGFAYHESRSSWADFWRWQVRRGRANYQFRKKVGNINSFVKLRFWSAKNILKENWRNWRLPLILGLLGASFSLQQWGYLSEKWKRE